MLLKLFDRWAAGKQRSEMYNFVELLRAMDGNEVGVTVAFATHTRHQLAESGYDLMQPAILVTLNPTITYYDQDAEAGQTARCRCINGLGPYTSGSVTAGTSATGKSYVEGVSARLYSC